MDNREAVPARKTVMRRKPAMIYVLAALYFLAPLLSVFQAYYYQRTLNYHDIILMLAYPVVGWGIFRMKSWGWYLLIAHVTALLVNNAVLAFMSDVDPVLLGKLSVLLVLMLVYFLQRQVRLPYHNPALRYWERQTPRYDATFHCRLGVPGLSEHPIETSAVNISLGGIYVCLPRESKLAKGTAIVVDVDHNGVQVHLEGRVAWSGEGDSEAPYGVGVAFNELDRVTRRGLNQLIRVAKNEWRTAHKTKAAQPA